MVTGDNERTAKAVAGKLGIDEIRAEVLPEDKARVIKELQDQSGRVAVAGASVAIQSAGFTLVKGNFDGFRFFDRDQWHCAQRVPTSNRWFDFGNREGHPCRALGNVSSGIAGDVVRPLFGVGSSCC